MTPFICKRRGIVSLLAGMGLAPLAAPGVSAQTWPTTGAVRLITPFPPGFATDNLSLPLARALSAAWMLDVSVLRMPGNSTMTAAVEAARAAGDGRTLLLMPQSVITAPLIVRDVGFDPIKDLAPLSLVARAPTLLVVAPTSPYRTVGDIIAAANARPGTLRYASTGLGSSFHLSGEQFKRAAGVDIAHVQLASAGETIEALISGRVDMVFPNSSGGMGAVREGRVRLLAVATVESWPQMPTTPTFAQTLPGFSAAAWFGLYAPASTPAAVLDRQSRDSRTAILSESVSRDMRQTGADVVGSTADDLRTLMREEQVRWTQLINSAGIAR
jgi:tripartite-type tricarboxylate transporter receptor subunit TctC